MLKYLSKRHSSVRAQAIKMILMRTLRMVWMTTTKNRIRPRLRGRLTKVGEPGMPLLIPQVAKKLRKQTLKQRRSLVGVNQLYRHLLTRKVW